MPTFSRHLSATCEHNHLLVACQRGNGRQGRDRLALRREEVILGRVEGRGGGATRQRRGRRLGRRVASCLLVIAAQKHVIVLVRLFVGRLGHPLSLFLIALAALAHTTFVVTTTRPDVFRKSVW